MGRRYPTVHDGEWVRPVRRGYRMRCCDCGLVHSFDFRLARQGERRIILFRADRDERATAACRRRTGKT